MSLPSHRLPPPVSQTVGGAAVAAAASGTKTEPNNGAGSAGNRSYRKGTSAAAAEQLVPVKRPMLPGRHNSTARTTAVTAADSKLPGSDIPRTMRPQSVLKDYVSYLTPYEQQEIVNYQQVARPCPYSRFGSEFKYAARLLSTRGPILAHGHIQGP